MSIIPKNVNYTKKKDKPSFLKICPLWLPF